MIIILRTHLGYTKTISDIIEDEIGLLKRYDNIIRETHSGDVQGPTIYLN